MTLEAIRRMLAALGYEVRFRDGEWAEVALMREGEAWLGAGRDRAQALEAALHKACPSLLARTLLQSVLSPGTDEDGAEAGSSAARPGSEGRAPARIDGRPEGSAVLELKPVPSELLPDLGAGMLGGGPQNSEGPTDAMVQAFGRIPSPPTDGRNGKPSGGGGLLRPSGIRAPTLRNTPPPLVRRDSIPAPRYDVTRSLDELDILADRIRDSREELGLCSPDRQRLAMLAWICEARAHTDAFPEDQRIRDRVGAISRQLTEIGKTFWPGSVTALQLQMQPRDLPRHVLGGPASTWSRAAELAERALRSLEYSDERRGFDAYGWADATQAAVPPPAAAEVIASLFEEIEAVGGPLAQNAVPRDQDARPEPEQFQTWVRKLRCLRLADIDPDRWARAAGRLRWWSSQREATLAQGARELEPAFAPDVSWAQLLQPAGEGDTGEGVGEAEKTTTTPALSTAPARMFEEVRAATAGKRLVFVSMRRDPDLQAQLKEALPAATLDWRVAEPKRLEALGEAIQQGAYDMVLGAIGFQSQGTDNLLARACRQAGVKYLRVNRGRPLVCLRAIARDFELLG